MVTFKNEGRLGNYLFEFANAYAYALRYGLQFTIPTRTHNQKWSPLYFPWMVDKSYDPTLPSITLRELGHNYYALPFKEKYQRCNVIMEGYFQSEKYFIDFAPQVIEAMRLPHENINYVGIHIRRGDYLQLPKKHILQSPAWLRHCVHYFVERGFKSFVVCSDGIRWAKETLDPLRVCGAEFSYSENNDEVADLTLLSCCQHMICSSSTFGWWGAYLIRNPEKQILIPEKWFGPSEKLPTADIVPPTWIKIPLL